MRNTSSIDDRLDSTFAEAWRPEPGEKLIGEVIDISEREGSFGRYPILTLRRDDGEEIAVHAFRTVLAQRLAEVRPKIGEPLGIKYVGERDGAERAYHDYRVAVDRPERAVDWSAYEDAPAEPASSDVPVDRAGLEESRAAIEGGGDDTVPF